MTGVEVRAGVPATRQADEPSVSVVVVNFNAGRHLQRCLDSIRLHGAGLARETIVVDNASTDGSDLHAERGDVRLVRSANVGFAAANNRAIPMTSGEFVLLLNPDAELLPDTLPVLVAALRSDPTAAAAAPRLVYPDGRLQRWTAGREPGVASVLAFATGLDRIADRFAAPTGLFLGRDVSDSLRPDWVSGACLLLRRAALDEVGLFDDTYFTYMEDVDLCRRLRRAGWGIRYEPEAGCVHVHGASEPAPGADKPDHAVSNLLRYHATLHGRTRHTLFRAAAVVGFATRYCAHSALALTGPRRSAHRTARAQHLRHVRAATARRGGGHARISLPDTAEHPGNARPIVTEEQ